MLLTEKELGCKKGTVTTVLFARWGLWKGFPSGAFNAAAYSWLILLTTDKALPKREDAKPSV
jgi:hypothetical protein